MAALWRKLNPGNAKIIRYIEDDAKYLYAEYHKGKSDVVHVLKIIRNQSNSEYLDMEREILSRFSPRQFHTRILLDTFTVKYQTKAYAKKIYNRDPYTNWALEYKKAEMSLRQLLATREIKPNQMFNLIKSIMLGIAYVHEHSIVMRRITADTFDIIGQNLDTAIVANFEDACIIPAAPGSRWEIVQNRTDQAVEFMSPELAKFLVAQQEAKNKALEEESMFLPNPVPITTLMSSDSFMIAQLIYFMVRKQSLYPKPLIETPASILSLYIELPGVYPESRDQLTTEGKIDFIFSNLSKRDPDMRFDLKALVGLATNNIDILPAAQSSEDNPLITDLDLDVLPDLDWLPAFDQSLMPF